MEVAHGPLRRLGLAFVALIGSAAATAAQARPMTWDSLCSAVGDFAGLVAVHRNEGVSKSTAIALARELFSNGPPELLDRAVTDEIARQVYATPALTPEQETASLKAKCLTPEKDASLPRPSGTVSSGHVITDLVPIPLDKGVNRVEAANGEKADIVLGWQDEGAGRGHDVFTVTIPSAGSDPPETATVSDDVGSGDDVLTSVRFATGNVDGQKAILLLVAARVAPAAKVVPTPTVFEVYRLLTDASGPNSRGLFELIERRMLPRRFCNADMALSEASGLALRPSYRGPRDSRGQFTANGCPESMAANP
jgi:hypothetical protein